MTAAQLVNVFGQMLRAEDTLLVRKATHIHLTADSRQMMLVVRARIALSSLPPNFCIESDIEAHSHVEGLLHVGAMTCSLVRNCGFLFLHTPAPRGKCSCCVAGFGRGVTHNDPC